MKFSVFATTLFSLTTLSKAFTIQTPFTTSKIGTIPTTSSLYAKKASSKEEDLELTRKVIMEYIDDAPDVVIEIQKDEDETEGKSGFRSSVKKVISKVTGGSD